MKKSGRQYVARFFYKEIKITTKEHVWLWTPIAAIACTFSIFALRTSAQSAQPTRIPLIRLIANPEKYHGKRIRTIGFVRLEFEGNVVYLHKEDYDHAILGNGVWINVPTTLNQQGKKSINMKYCIIEGTFDARNGGHMSLWSGSLKNISRLEAWR